MAHLIIRYQRASEKKGRVRSRRTDGDKKKGGRRGRSYGDEVWGDTLRVRQRDRLGRREEDEARGRWRRSEGDIEMVAGREGGNIMRRKNRRVREREITQRYQNLSQMAE